MKRYLPYALFLFALYAYLVGRADPAPLSAADIDQSPLSISKVAYPDPFISTYGGNYRLVLYNSGTVTLTDVAIEDTVPDGTSCWVCSGCWKSGNTLHWNMASFPPGSSYTHWFKVSVERGVEQVVNDQYSASAPGVPAVTGPPVVSKVITPTPYPPPPPETPPPSPTAPADREPPAPSPTPPGEPLLVLSQDVSNPAAGPGDTLIHRVTVTNQGTGGAPDVVLAVQVPAGLELQEVTISPDAAHEWTGDILWVAWGYLEPGASASVELHGTVRPGVSAADLVVHASVPDYGLESGTAAEVPSQVLPDTGPSRAPWWGWLLLAGGLLLGGLLLRRELRGDSGEG